MKRLSRELVSHIMHSLQLLSTDIESDYRNRGSLGFGYGTTLPEQVQID